MFRFCDIRAGLCATSRPVRFACTAKTIFGFCLPGVLGSYVVLRHNITGMSHFATKDTEFDKALDKNIGFESKAISTLLVKL